MKNNLVCNKKRYLLIVILSILVLVAMFSGRYDMKLEELFIKGTTTHTILTEIRLPRILLSILSGGSLALAGYVFQSLFQNPLVSGDVLGVSQGASAGAIVAMLIGCSPMGVTLFSFVSGLMAVAITVLLASRMKGKTILHLILLGIIVGALGNAFIMILKLGADPLKELPAIEFWLMGSFASISWKDVFLPSVIIIVASVVLYFLRYPIYILSHGDEEAKTLGIPLDKVRYLSIFMATLLIAATISTAGLISWVGLMAPHIIRLLCDKPIHRLIPEIFIGGGVLLLVADTLARSLWTFEMPLSVLTSVMGAIFLLILLLKQRIRL